MANQTTAGQHGDALFAESSALIDDLVSKTRQGTLPPDRLNQAVRVILKSAGSLPKQAQGRLQLRVAEGLAKAQGPPTFQVRPNTPGLVPYDPSAAARGYQPGTTQNVIDPAVFHARAIVPTQQTTIPIGGSFRPAGIPEGANVPGAPPMSVTMPGAGDASQQVRAQMLKGAILNAQAAATAQKVAEHSAAAIKAGTERVRAIEMPAIFGGLLGRPDVTKNPAVAVAMERLQAAKGPIEANMAGTEAMTAAEAARAQAGRRAGVGRTLIGGSLMALIASKLFGGNKDQMDPQVQMALAQQLAGRGGGEQDEGKTDTRTLMNMGRLLSLLKGVQSMGGMQGAAPRPQLI